MKKKDWPVITATLAYTCLFYDQGAGLNFLLFSLLLVILCAISKPGIMRQGRWIMVAACVVYSGAMVFVHGSALAILANIMSLLLLAAFTFDPRFSIPTGLIHSFYSTGGVPVFIYLDLIKSFDKSNGEKNKGIRPLTYAIPLILILLFFLIYKNANPLFREISEKYLFDFLTLSWFFFTLGGFILVYGFILHRRIPGIDEWEMKVSARQATFPQSLKLINEKSAAVILFTVMNLMILLINILDVNFLYLGAGMPEGITHKEFVHNGVGNLILSILLGIGVLMFVFRKPAENRLIYILGILWIAQNLFMVASTCIRNNMYVAEALLTYKRIGVYYWLLLAVIGLITTLMRLRTQTPVWRIFRLNAMVALLTLVASSSIDWDKFIGDFNMDRIKYTASLDKRYLIDISETNLPRLYNYRNDPEFNTDSVYHYGFYHSSVNDNRTNTSALDRKLYDYLLSETERDWRSINIRRKRINRELSALDNNRVFDTLDITEVYKLKHTPLKRINNLTVLKRYNRIDDSLVANINRLPRVKVIYTDTVIYEDLLAMKKLKSVSKVISRRRVDPGLFSRTEKLPFELTGP